MKDHKYICKREIIKDSMIWFDVTLKIINYWTKEDNHAIYTNKFLFSDEEPSSEEDLPTIYTK